MNAVLKAVRYHLPDRIVDNRELASLSDKWTAEAIYEKTGIWFKNFMIDEFQDTSTLQWENFKPLILNSLS